MKLITSIFSIALFSAFHASAALVEFDSNTEVSQYFDLIGSQKLISGTNGGLTGSLAASVDDQYSNSTLVSRFPLPAGSATPTFSISIYFYTTTIDTGAGDTTLGLGLSKSASYDPYGPSNFYSMYGLSKGAFQTRCGVVYRSGSGIGSSSIIPAFTSGQWFRLSLDAAWNSSISRYSLLGRVYTSDSQGTLGNLINSVSFTDGFLLSDYRSGVYPFITLSGPVQLGGISLVDRLSFPVSVPEPSVISILVTAGTIFGAIRLKRCCI